MATHMNSTQRNTAWVIGGILVVALVLGFIWMSTGNRDLANMEPAAGEQIEQPSTGFDYDSPMRDDIVGPMQPDTTP